MSKPEPQRAVDRWSTRAPNPRGQLATDPREELVDGDFATGTSPGATLRPPSLAGQTPLWRVMNPRVVCVRPDLGIDSLISMLFAFDLRSVPVVDDEGRPIGVVSRSDLLRHGRDGAGEVVADVMMCLAFALPESATLSHAAAVMAYEDVHQIPVVASDHRVVGLVTSLDVARWLARHDGYLLGGGAPEDC